MTATISHLAYGFYNGGIDNGTAGYITWRFVQLSTLKYQLSGLQLNSKKKKNLTSRATYLCFCFFLPNNKSLYSGGGAKKLERFNLFFYTAQLLIK